MNLKYRHELKFVITDLEYRELQPVLCAMMDRDSHAEQDGHYNIRSLYFDDMYRTAYVQKLDGVENRKKYRIRIYNCEDRSISLECKYKRGAYIRKEAVRLTREEYAKMLNLDYTFLLRKEQQVAKEFFVDARTNRLRPWVIVEYDREPFINDVGTVRITFDKNVRAISPEENMFFEEVPSFSVLPPGKMILEIKFTEILPEKIRRLFRKYSFVQTNASKFCLCADKLGEVMR